MKYLPQAEG